MKPFAKLLFIWPKTTKFRKGEIVKKRDGTLGAIRRWKHRGRVGFIYQTFHDQNFYLEKDLEEFDLK